MRCVWFVQVLHDVFMIAYVLHCVFTGCLDFA